MQRAVGAHHPQLKATRQVLLTAGSPSRFLHFLMEQFHKLPVTYRPRLGKSTDPLAAPNAHTETQNAARQRWLSALTDEVHISHKVLDRCTLPARPQPRQRARLGAPRRGTPLAVTFAGSAAQLARGCPGTAAPTLAPAVLSAAQLVLDVVADAWSGGEALCQRPPRSDAPRLVLHTVKCMPHLEPALHAPACIERCGCGNKAR